MHKAGARASSSDNPGAVRHLRKQSLADVVAMESRAKAGEESARPKTPAADSPTFCSYWYTRALPANVRGLRIPWLSQAAGRRAYMTSRFQINRRKTPLRNRAEYVRQLLGIVTEPTPPQLNLRLTGITIDCEEEAYFPPRRNLPNQGRKYREVGFYNINWQAHGLHGADRASLGSRLCCSSRSPVKFNDGKIDMFRWKFASFFKNPGTTMQTDKKEDMLLNFSTEQQKGKGVFFQWDGEARYAFNPDGEDFQIYIRKVLNVPVVIGPWVDERLTGDLSNGEQVEFSFFGKDAEDKQAVRRRVLQLVSGGLDTELIASVEDTYKEIILRDFGCRPENGGTVTVKRCIRCFPNGKSSICFLLVDEQTPEGRGCTPWADRHRHEGFTWGLF
eukprot:s262_g26.t1